MIQSNPYLLYLSTIFYGVLFKELKLRIKSLNLFPNMAKLILVPCGQMITATIKTICDWGATQLEEAFVPSILDYFSTSWVL